MEISNKRTIHTEKVLQKYFQASWRYPWYVIAGFVGAIGLEATNVISPLYLRQIINTVASHQPSSDSSTLILYALGFYALYSLLGWVFQRVRMTSITYMESWVMRDLSNEAYDALMRHSHDFFQSNFAGSLTRRVARYSKSFEAVFDSFVLTFVPIACYAIGTVVVLSERSPVLGVGLLAWIILFLIIQRYMTKWRHEYKVTRAKEDSVVTGILSDSVSNHSTVTLFASLDREKELYGNAVSRWMNANLAAWNADNAVYTLQGLIAVLSEVGILWAGVYFWSIGIITPGDFLLIQVYVLGMISRLWEIGRVTRRLNDSYADASEMIDILEHPLEIEDVPNASPLVVTKGQITFSDVSFGFNEGNAVLEAYSLTVHPGEKIALVGPSGAGKSTITKILLRLHDVSEGTVAIDDQNIATVQQESLRHAIGYVPQESILFHRTLKENIAYGNPSAAEDDIIAAAKKAHAHEFISKLPQGYDTFVGERGVKLSGGERQRVAIARALLKNAPILVLDEATSSLDSESENLIQEALDTLMEGKTVIVIAHRLSTIMKMDRIVVMEHGKIAAQGTHDELLSQGGLYAKLWNIQAGGFLADQEEEV